MATSLMRSFWDKRASENPMFFVDNKLAYTQPDTELFWRRGEQELDRLLTAVGARVDPSDDILDIGCGVGRLTRVLARRGRLVHGLDISPRMLELAREQCRDLDNVEFILGDGESLRGVEDQSVDACVSYVVFQHIPDPAITLGYVREMGRVLRRGGWAAFQVSNNPQLHRRRTGRQAIGIVLRALVRHGPKGQAHPAWLGAAVELSDLRQAARDGGMEVERVVGEGEQFCFVRTRKL